VSQHDTWGIQIGGVQTPTDYHDCDLRKEEISIDHDDRVGDFKRRHGGLIDGTNRNEGLESGCRGWSEIYAVDGYVLRVEWSRFEMRGAMRVLEFRPPESARPFDH
jgi:hypothetical protein